eukprot:CAMPEP_0194060602 /NCGR_PEP_ID=MMETSP0009_2-20130614/72210_1 /TAXON_ID=210454 /ORGANISM="Grammatophora oceanica, Strain CCMP 410" /LENGTH=33 /DNA_ID= /DNA_START= /DNA_END= /DNA_ORIENTATION=
MVDVLGLFALSALVSVSALQVVLKHAVIVNQSD